MNKWIRKGDKVLVLAGNEKGKQGTVLSRSEERVVVQGVNLHKKHVKKTQQSKGQIVDREMPLHISNVQLCDDNGTPLKLRVKIEKDERSLVFKDNTGAEKVFRKVRKSAS